MLARRLELLVENSNEPERPVVIEMLRQVVLGNFGAINGRRGDKAQGVLDQMYPSGGALPGFHRSNWDNASGMFVRNALLDETRDPSYAVLCGLLVKVIDGGWMEPPEIEVPRLPESTRLSIDELRALLSSK